MSVIVQRATQGVRDKLDSMGVELTTDICKAAAEVAVSIERERCIAIINSARNGDIDTDLRAIWSWIEGGDMPSNG